MSHSNCKCGKISFNSEAKAKSFLSKQRRNAGFHGQSVYQCREDRFYWHMTSQNKKSKRQNLAVQKITVRKVSWFDAVKPWTVANESGVIVSNHRRHREALNYAIDMTRKKA